MNRTNTFKVGLLAATALTLAACGEAKEDALAYQSVESCVAAGQHDAATCKAEFEKAQKRHAAVAPRYQNSNSCYSDFGYNQCRVHHTSSGSIWLPFMVGYMLAPRGVNTVYTQPLYRPARDPGNYYTGGNSRVGTVSRSGATQVAKSQVSRPSARTRTVSRGGFGARSVSSGS